MNGNTELSKEKKNGYFRPRLILSIILSVMAVICCFGGLVYFRVLDIPVIEDFFEDIGLIRTDHPEEETEQWIKSDYHKIGLEEAPEGLDEFLNDFAWVASYGEHGEESLDLHEYDCSDGRETWIFPSLVWITDLFERYPVNREMDGVYSVCSADDIDWILKNIYNFSPEAIDRVKQENNNIIYSDGKYRGWVLGAGEGYGVKNIDVNYNGKYYLVSYDCGSWYPGADDLVLDQPVSKHYALLEYKVINGKGYWSIYKDTIHRDTIPDAEKVFPDDETETDNEESPDVTDWNNIAEQYYAIYMSYLDFINAKGDTNKLKNVGSEQKARFEENYIKYNAGDEFTNQIFDFDVTASTITDKGNGIYEVDCYVHVVNSDKEIKTGNVTSNDVTIHAELRYNPDNSAWILTYQKGENYSFAGHTMIHCGKE